MPPLPRPPVLRRRRPHGLPRLSPSLAPRPAAVVRALWATGAAVRRLPPVRRLAGHPAPRSLGRVARGRRARGGARPQVRRARAPPRRPPPRGERGGGAGVGPPRAPPPPPGPRARAPARPHTERASG